MKIEEMKKITLIEETASHKERHPSDKNERNPNKGVRYEKRIEEISNEPTPDAIKKAQQLIENAKYASLTIDDMCPKCNSKIVWKGSTKYRNVHCRCSKGCLI
jgi:hypothetical protein